MRACLTEPAAFENGIWIDRVFIQGINEWGLPEAAKQLQDIADKADRIGKSADHFPADADGFKQIASYIEPVEHDLAHAVPQTRAAILRAAYQRQTEIAVALLRQGTANTGGETFDRLVLLNAAYDTVIKHPDLSPDGLSVAHQAEGAIQTSLQVLLDRDLEPVANAPATLDGLVQLTDRIAAARAKYAAFAASARVASAFDTATTRAAAMEADILPPLQQQVAAAKDRAAIVAIRQKLEAVAANNADLTKPLWLAYHQGLSDWMRAAIDAHLFRRRSPRGRRPPSSHRPSCEASRLASAIYQNNFRVIYTKGLDAHFYVERLALNLGRFCPEATTGDFINELERRLTMVDDLIRLDPQHLDLGQLNRIGQRIAPFLDSGRISFIAGYLNDADADAQAVQASTPCNDAALSLFMHNASSGSTIRCRACRATCSP
ncbi:MAG: hypothetical protein WDN49_27715 [Acetobacteraceae bacterium]